MDIFQIISHKKRKLKEETEKEEPDKNKIRRLKKSISRHKKELKIINKARRYNKKNESKEKM